MNDHGLKASFDAILSILDDNEKMYRASLFETISNDKWNDAESAFNEVSEKIRLINGWSDQLSQLMTEILDSGLIIDDNAYDDFDKNLSEQENDANGNQIYSSKSSGRKNVPLGYDLMNKRVCGFRFEDVDYMDLDMSGCLIKVCEILYNMNSLKFYHVMNSDISKSDRFEYISTSSELSPRQKLKGVRNCYRRLEIDTGDIDIYIWTNTNNKVKTRMLENMLDIYEIDHNKLSFYIE